MPTGLGSRPAFSWSHPGKSNHRGAVPTRQARPRPYNKFSAGRQSAASIPAVEGGASGAHGAHDVELARRVERFAQAPDMHVGGARLDIDGGAPDGGEDLL